MGTDATLYFQAGIMFSSETDRLERIEDCEISVEQIRARVAKAQRNYTKDLTAVEQILRNERGYVSKVPNNEPVVVLMSGGLDSIVMVNKIIEDWNVTVHPLYIRRNSTSQKHEEKAFDFFVKFYQKRFGERFANPKKIEYEIPPRDMKKGFPKAMRLTVGHPLRNSTMQNLAVMYAVSLQGSGVNAKIVFSGSVYEDNTEPELGLLSLRTQTLNTCVSLGDWGWNITSPLTDPYLADRPLGKIDLIGYAVKRFIPLERTRSCFSADKYADGTCNACKKRLMAFDHLKMRDPVTYLTDIKNTRSTGPK
jgi:7-cyano-7-deazaguanine synthase in queuosine biosynthesis